MNGAFQTGVLDLYFLRRKITCAVYGYDGGGLVAMWTLRLQRQRNRPSVLPAHRVATLPLCGELGAALALRSQRRCVGRALLHHINVDTRYYDTSEWLPKARQIVIGAAANGLRLHIDAEELLRSDLCSSAPPRLLHELLRPLLTQANVSLVRPRQPLPSAAHRPAVIVAPPARIDVCDEIFADADFDAARDLYAYYDALPE